MAAPLEAESRLNRNLGGKEIKCKCSCVIVQPKPAGLKLRLVQTFLTATRKCQWTLYLLCQEMEMKVQAGQAELLEAFPKSRRCASVSR